MFVQRRYIEYYQKNPSATGIFLAPLLLINIPVPSSHTLSSSTFSNKTTP